jgi:hypothetical protein
LLCALAAVLLLAPTDQHGEIVASVTSSTHERKSKTNIAARNGKIYLKHNAFGWVASAYIIDLLRLV